MQAKLLVVIPGAAELMVIWIRAIMGTPVMAVIVAAAGIVDAVVAAPDVRHQGAAVDIN